MSTVFDYENSLQRMGGDQNLFREIVGLLIADAPPLLKTVRLGRQAADYAGVQLAAHTLKGLAANFGAERAVAAAADVERRAKQRDESGMEAAVAELAEALDELVAALEGEVPAGRMSLLP